MDELELLKNSWKNSQQNYPKYDQNDLYKMLHKKSITTVKWILIISIIELVIITLLDIYVNQANNNDKLVLKQYHIYNIINILTYIHYTIIVGFIYLFYKNYKKINISDNLKKLMSQILLVKKITNYYIIYNLSLMAITSVIYAIAAMIYDPLITQADTQENRFTIYIGFGFGLLIGFSALIGLYYLIYRMLYGRLIRKLTKNYTELKKLDL